MSTFPSVNIPDSQKNDQWCKDYIDAVINYHRGRVTRRTKIKEIYRKHNGLVNTKTKKIMLKKYGSDVSTDFVSYKLGRSKIGILKGEFLDIDLKTNVDIINADAIEERMRKSNMIRGASYLKDEMTEFRNSGLNPLNGIEIPDVDDPDFEAKVNPGGEVERSMQAIIDDKINTLHLKLSFLQNFIHCILTAETHGYVFRNKHGIEDYKVISTDNAIFQESENDPLCKQSPFHGHVEWMYPEDIVSMFPNEDPAVLKQIKDLDGQLDSSDHKIEHRMAGGRATYPVYFIEFRAPIKEVRKISPKKGSDVPYRLSMDSTEYEKNRKKINREVENGKYEIEVRYRDAIYGGVRVSEEIYLGLGRKSDTMYTIDANGKKSQLPNYVHILYDTVDSDRISIGELILSLSEMYDSVMFAITSEIRKLKGKVFIYDEALKPKLSTMKSVFYDVIEHSVIRINSAQDGNYGERDITNAASLIQELDLGLSQSFGVLLELKRDVEATLDKVTGINDAREGSIRPTMSATGAVQNLEASRSATRDLYFFMEEFISEVLTRMAEKTKLNDEYLQNKKSFRISREVIKHLSLNKNIPFNNYVISINSGKKDNELRDRIRNYFPQEINAGNIRVLDVIKFEREKNIELALQFLEEGYTKIQEFAMRQQEIDLKKTETQIQAQREMAIEDREDRQEHEKELVILKEEASSINKDRAEKRKLEDTKLKMQNKN